MLREISIFLKAASLSCFLSLWWMLRGLLFGTDANSRNAGLAAFVLSLLFGTLALSQIEKLPERIRKALPLLVPLLLFWILFLFALSNPFSLAPYFPPPTGGTPVLRAALEMALSLALPALYLASFAKESIFRLSTSLFGVATGLFLQEILLLPLLGWAWSSALWMAVLVFAERLDADRNEPDLQHLPGPIALPLSLYWGFVAGALFVCARVFVIPHLSGGRFSEISILGISVVGLGLGCLLALSFEWNQKGAARRILAGLAGPLLAAGALWGVLYSMAGSRFSGPLRSLGAEGGYAAELFMTSAGVSIPSLILGFALGSLLSKSSQILPLVSGVFAGAFLSLPLIPNDFIRVWVPGRAGEQVLDHKITEDGLLTRTRAVRESHSSLIHWNRGAISRGADWAKTERQEILLPVALSSPWQKPWIGGTLFAAHKAALGAAGIENPEVLDPAPHFLEDDTASAEKDLFRFLAASQENRYEEMVLLSSPTLHGGQDLFWTTQSLDRLSRISSPQKKIFLWLDLRALRNGQIGTLLRTFFEVFPGGRLWIAQDVYAGPLICLEATPVRKETPSLPAEIPLGLLAEGRDLANAIQAFPLSTLFRPKGGSSIPVAAPPFGLPAPDSLRNLASILAPDPQNRPAIWYLLDGLALHAEAQIEPGPFTSELERVTVSEEELQQFTTGLQLFPEDKPLHHILTGIGRLLLGKRDYQKALNFASQWVKICPNDPDFLYLLGRIDHELLDHELAIPLLERAAALQPNSAEIHEMLGKTYASLKRWKDAAGSFQEASTLKPEEPLYAKQLGISCFESGDYSRARDYLQRAATALQADIEIRDYLEKLRESGK